MSKPSYKFPFDDIRGKMGDVVLCHGQKFQYARVYVPYDHTRKITELEANLRYNFKRGVELWRLFDLTWKKIYSGFAYYSTKNRLSGYSVFLREYINMVTGCERETCVPGECSACPPGECRFRELSHAQADMVFWRAMELWEAGAGKEEAFKKAKEYVKEL